MKQPLMLFDDEPETPREEGFVKALSVQEPWLSMIVSGRKTIETRSFPTKYRGTLLLCGSKKVKGIYAGVAACLVDLVDCQPMMPEDRIPACCDLYPRAYSWFLENVRKVEPVPIKGTLGIFDVEKWKVREL